MTLRTIYEYIKREKRRTLIILFSIVSSNSSLGLNCIEKSVITNQTVLYSKSVDAELKYNSQNESKIKVYYTVVPRYCTAIELKENHFQKNSDYVVLIPGGPLSPQYFTNSDLVTKLREHFNIILPEYRSADLQMNQYQDADIYNTKALASDLELIRKAELDEKPWHVLGHSYGAYLALYYSSMFPEKTKTLVLANGFHNYRPFADQLTDAINKTYRLRISRYFKFDSDEQRKFLNLYDQLVELSRKGQLMLSQERRSGKGRSIYKVPEDVFDFPLVSLIESHGLQRVIAMFQGWITGSPSSVSWLAKHFYQNKTPTENLFNAFNCGEAIPQIEKNFLFEEKYSLKIPQMKKLADCNNFVGQIRDSIIPLDQVKQPTLIIASENDQMINSTYQFETHSKIPQSHFELISDAGHFPFKRETAASEKVLNFLLNHIEQK